MQHARVNTQAREVQILLYLKPWTFGILVALAQNRFMHCVHCFVAEATYVRGCDVQHIYYQVRALARV